jgi:hypothetical protein
MAVYFGLAIDCGTNENLANKLLEFFNKVNLEITQDISIPCKTFKEHKHDLWLVSVWPEGMGYATHPTCRPELAENPLQELIKNKLYETLKKFPGFRRALFGREAYDYLANTEPKDDNNIDSIDMIFSTLTFPIPAKNLILAPFSKGYSMVVGRSENSQYQ